MSLKVRLLFAGYCALAIAIAAFLLVRRVSSL
jgi:hypothetical protein